jgi:hypothetical protein
MSLDDFKSQYGANFVPVIGVSSSSQIKKAKNTEEFLKGDCWIVFDAKKVSLPEDHSVD